MIIVPIISLFSSHVYKRLNNSPAMWPVLGIFPRAEEMYTFFTIRRFFFILEEPFFHITGPQILLELAYTLKNDPLYKVVR